MFKKLFSSKKTKPVPVEDVEEDIKSQIKKYQEMTDDVSKKLSLLKINQLPTTDKDCIVCKKFRNILRNPNQMKNLSEKAQLGAMVARENCRECKKKYCGKEMSDKVLCEIIAEILSYDEY